MSRRDRRAAARKSQTKAPGAGSPAELCEAALHHMSAGRDLDAQLCCQRALAVDSGHADALHLMGVLSFRAKQYDHAVEWIAQAIRQDPRADYLASLGNALQHQGRLEEALKAFDKAVQLKPDAAELWRQIGNLFLELNRPAEALLSFQHVLKLDPHNWSSAYNSGILLHQAGRLEEAISCFSLCNELKPDHVLTLYLRGRSLNGLKRFEEALADNRRAHALDPNDSDICNNIGGILQFLGRYDEALQWLDKALNLRPDNLDALNNKTVWLEELHRFDEAFASYDRLRMADPGNATTEWNLSLLHLLTGNFEAGWAGREARWRKLPPPEYPEFSQPKWLGDRPIEGKTILIRADEGLGDVIQFVRYVPLVAALGARVILSVPSSLCSLMSTLSGVAQCISNSTTTLPPFDMHCPISSLPLAFRTRLDTIPSSPYLPLPGESRVQAWKDRLGPHHKLRVGLVWSGNPRHLKDHSRSIPLSMFSRLLDVDATFVSLQKDPRPSDKATLHELSEIIDPTLHLTDFSETAALVSCLDLVITVDTSTAHLSGALGRPTWILLPYTPDFRWLLDRDDSPWYPTVRLFRQTETRDYGMVLDRVRSELLTLISTR